MLIRSLCDVNEWIHTAFYRGGLSTTRVIARSIQKERFKNKKSVQNYNVIAIRRGNKHDAQLRESIEVAHHDPLKKLSVFTDEHKKFEDCFVAQCSCTSTSSKTCGGREAFFIGVSKRRTIESLTDSWLDTRRGAMEALRLLKGIFNRD